ncbi:hypothetical protein JWS13_39000 [Rhodococcus pseudokoreensis]|uniref:Uncharacterized protein n=1 Tax=Rhodococcus pseudokoreensis TaxID=2811421 RepID=A0A974ZY11_9NOCA|nr:hypothetical protein [Rhodococcus pseudokoreensis]QSE94167.1 hypothetical protein JWS13_39000 [Rhodococcus pseudokoreensis]
MAEQLVSPQVEELARELEADPELRSGRHMLVIAEGDCQVLSMCSCGLSFPAVRPDVSLDAVFSVYERHAMTSKAV